jgi:hypothetical protein
VQEVAGQPENARAVAGHDFGKHLLLCRIMQRL